MPTLGERLRQEGVDKKVKEVVKNGLAARVPLETIATLAGITVDRVQQIKMQLTLAKSGPIAEAANNSGSGPERRA